MKIHSMNVIHFLVLTLLLVTSPVLAVEDIIKQEAIEYQPKILGGIESKNGDWPWIAALLNTHERDMYQAQFCSGVLIDNTWVLTAAHCVNGMSSNEIEVAVGVFDLTNFSGNRVSVRNIRIHPQYNTVNDNNDIALLQLNQPSNGQTIPLFTGESIENIPPSLLGKMLTALGWGMADDSSYWYYPEKLRQVDLPVVADNYCNEIYPSPLIASQICAGYYEGKDVCNGDSGGPVIAEIDGTWVHVGLVSLGTPCDTYGGWYGIYTRTSAYIEFIKQFVPGADFWPPRRESIVPILQLLLLNNNDSNAVPNNYTLS